MGKVYIEERAVELAHYIIDSKDTVRGAARKFGISKSTVHKDVTLQNGLICGQADVSFVAEHSVLHIPEYIEIGKAFLAKKKPVVKLELVIK